MYKTIKIGLFLIIAGLIPCKGQYSDKIDSLINDYYKQGYFNGSVLVAQNGEILFEKGFGYANFEWNIKNTPSTKFRIGSLTKPFVSLLIMQLVSEGKMELHKPITAYLPDYRKDIGDSITVFNLLTHTSGLPDYTDGPGFWSDSVKNNYTKDYVLHHFCSKNLEFKPGQKFEYSNTGYFILGLIIEKVTEKSFNTYLREKLLNPLKMENTGIDCSDSVILQRACGYIKATDHLINAPYINFDNIFTAGGMYSTVDDLFLFDKALFGSELLSDSLKSIMFTPYLDEYALGWGTKNYEFVSQKTIKVIAHSGSIKGFKSIFFHIIDNHSVIILLDNTYSGEKRFEICERILGILYNDKLQ
jgi:CubicO group peptidase (beta-lactamase class C family)